MTIDIPNWALWVFVGAFIISTAVNVAMPGKERRGRRFIVATLLEVGILCYALAARGM